MPNHEWATSTVQVPHHHTLTAGTFLLILVLSLQTPSAFSLLCPRGCFCHPPDQLVVDCSNAKLTHVSIMLNPRLKTLVMRGNRIKQISVDELSTYGELEQLDLSNNELTIVKQFTFDRLSKLKTLNLSGNMLTKVRRDDFYGMSSLESLDLSSNSLTALAAGVFSELEELKFLNLSKNSISVFDPYSMRGLQNLNRLLLQHNEISEFKPDSTLPNLRELDLSYNFLTNLSNQSFEQLLGLKTLHLVGNDIQMINEHAFGKQAHPLRELLLDDNELFELPTLCFRSLPDLHTLSLSQNPIGELSTSGFEGLSNLRLLVVTNCPRLRRVSLNAFSGLFQLKILWLSENPLLSDMDPFAFELDPEAIHLRLVYFHGNNLSSLPHQLLHWSELEGLDLRDNPWNCDCKMRWMTSPPDSVTASGSSHNDAGLHHLYHTPGVQGAECSCPDELRNQSLAKLPRGKILKYCGDQSLLTTMLDSPRKVAAIAGACLALVMLGCVICVLVVCFRRKVSNALADCGCCGGGLGWCSLAGSESRDHEVEKNKRILLVDERGRHHLTNGNDHNSKSQHHDVSSGNGYWSIDRDGGGANGNKAKDDNSPPGKGATSAISIGCKKKKGVSGSGSKNSCYKGCNAWNSPERQSFLSSDGSGTGSGRSGNVYFPTSVTGSGSRTGHANDAAVVSRDSSFKVLAEYPVPITEL